MSGLVFFFLCIGAVLASEPESIKCPALPPTPGQLIDCLHDGQVVNCSVPAVEGTTATLTCKPSYVMKSEDEEHITSVTCRVRRGRGSWGQTLASCVATDDCGVQNPRDMVISGEQVKPGVLPWHVNVYADNGDNWWNRLGLGTLISPTHVVTSAYMMSKGDGGAMPVSGVQMRAGQLLRQLFNVVEPDSQIRGVAAIFVHDQFVQADQIHDIALIVANASFQLTWNVNVACMDWTNQFPPVTALDNAIVAAQKPGIHDTRREIYEGHYFAVLSRPQCMQQLDRDYARRFTADRICARAMFGDTCSEYFGTGLLTKRSTNRGPRFYLDGVQVTSLSWAAHGACDLNRLSGFTNVTQHIGWIQKHMNAGSS